MGCFPSKVKPVDYVENELDALKQKRIALIFLHHHTIRKIKQLTKSITQ